MKDQVGYIGKFKGHNVHFDGLLYTITINNLTFAIDEWKLGKDLERRG